MGIEWLALYWLCRDVAGKEGEVRHTSPGLSHLPSLPHLAVKDK